MLNHHCFRGDCLKVIDRRRAPAKALLPIPCVYMYLASLVITCRQSPAVSTSFLQYSSQNSLFSRPAGVAHQHCYQNPGLCQDTMQLSTLESLPIHCDAGTLNKADTLCYSCSVHALHLVLVYTRWNEFIYTFMTSMQSSLCAGMQCSA